MWLGIKRRPAPPIWLCVAACLALACTALCACSSAQAQGAAPAAPVPTNVVYTDAFNDAYPADMSGYATLSSSGTTCFVNVSAQEAAGLMDEGQTFALFAGFANCPFCNVVIPYVNEAAANAGVRVGYLNTRSNPAWTANTQIDDYDLFVERFGAYLDTDDAGEPHLYTPELFCAKRHGGGRPQGHNPRCRRSRPTAYRRTDGRA